MAFSNLEKAMGLVIGLDLARPGTSRQAAKAAITMIGRAGMALAPRAATATTGLVQANPVTAGVGLGLGALQTPPGQALLDAAAARGAADRIAAQQMLDEAIFRSTTLPARQIEQAVATPGFKPALKRKVSKYSKAVKAGISAVKASKFGGKKGKISNAKAVFSTVNKVASAVNKGKKGAKTGIRGVAARAIRRIL